MKRYAMTTLQVPVEVNEDGTYIQLTDRMQIIFTAIAYADLPPKQKVKSTVNWNDVFDTHNKNTSIHQPNIYYEELDDTDEFDYTNNCLIPYNSNDIGTNTGHTIEHVSESSHSNTYVPPTIQEHAEVDINTTDTNNQIISTQPFIPVTFNIQPRRRNTPIHRTLRKILPNNGRFTRISHIDQPI